MAVQSSKRVTSFGFNAGRILVRKYEVLERIGSGWEGEVYLLRELKTGIEKAGKFFFPHRNLQNRMVKFHAKKLYKLRHCPIVMHYHTQETIQFRKVPVTFLVSEFVEGELLSEFLKRQAGKRFNFFEALCLLHDLATGMEEIHALNEYHGDLHTDNIIVQRYGLGFDLKLIDLFHWKAPRPQNIKDDVCDMIRLFYDIIGGAKRYAKQPAVVKDICCGLKRSMILKKFKTAGQLRQYLESLEWE